MKKIAESRILIIATNGFEQSELEVPRTLLGEAGARVDLATPDGKEIVGWKKDDWGAPVTADLSIDEAMADDYDALVLPGGQINPDILRTNERAMALVRAFVADGKTVAAICHAPWVLIEADALKGREATSYHSIRKDVENAGAIWKDEKAVSSDGIITSRNPDDLHDFVGAIVVDIESRTPAKRAA